MHTEQYRGSFIGYFPSDNPKYSIMVLINKPQSNYYGSLSAAPLFKIISDKIFSGDREINKSSYEQINQIEMPVTKNGYRDDLKKTLAYVHVPYKDVTNPSLWISTEVQNDIVFFKNHEELDNKVPCFDFMGARDAVFLAESLGLNPIIKGRGFVYHQSINPGVGFKQGTSIILDLK